MARVNECDQNSLLTIITSIDVIITYNHNEWLSCIILLCEEFYVTYHFISFARCPAALSVSSYLPRQFGLHQQFHIFHNSMCVLFSLKTSLTILQLTRQKWQIDKRKFHSTDCVLSWTQRKRFCYFISFIKLKIDRTNKVVIWYSRVHFNVQCASWFFKSFKRNIDVLGSEIKVFFSIFNIRLKSYVQSEFN